MNDGNRIVDPAVTISDLDDRGFVSEPFMSGPNHIEAAHVGRWREPDPVRRILVEAGFEWPTRYYSAAEVRAIREENERLFGPMPSIPSMPKGEPRTLPADQQVKA